jgi:hypothetical protein
VRFSAYQELKMALEASCSSSHSEVSVKKTECVEMSSKKIEKESVVCRRTALFLRDFRWQTRNTDNSGQTQRTARRIARDKTGHKILEKAAVRTTWVESPYHIPLRSSFRTVETSRQMSAKVMP